MEIDGDKEALPVFRKKIRHLSELRRKRDPLAIHAVRQLLAEIPVAPMERTLVMRAEWTPILHHRQVMRVIHLRRALGSMRRSRGTLHGGPERSAGEWVIMRQQLVDAICDLL